MKTCLGATFSWNHVFSFASILRKTRQKNATSSRVFNRVAFSNLFQNVKMHLQIHELKSHFLAKSHFGSCNIYAENATQHKTRLKGAFCGAAFSILGQSLKHDFCFNYIIFSSISSRVSLHPFTPNSPIFIFVLYPC